MKAQLLTAAGFFSCGKPAGPQSRKATAAHGRAIASPSDNPPLESFRGPFSDILPSRVRDLGSDCPSGAGERSSNLLDRLDCVRA
jgi:hypothetical protein